MFHPVVGGPASGGVPRKQRSTKDAKSTSGQRKPARAPQPRVKKK